MAFAEHIPAFLLLHAAFYETERYGRENISAFSAACICDLKDGVNLTETMSCFQSLPQAVITSPLEPDKN
jgi:hypothetical protein